MESATVRPTCPAKRRPWEVSRPGEGPEAAGRGDKGFSFLTAMFSKGASGGTQGAGHAAEVHVAARREVRRGGHAITVGPTPRIVN
ncbi:hypothetical protein GCM10010156_40000 [Planobispora rosea]|uniref:Uncharacterized protein n=1 Tax=Planobispora rosea TaxID=35762 RepID=A0A8J3S7G8_PLARO|nr:hypothetical protein GCM10010156_40000 [Planobispora rosea]GIH88703.1 hypothetical protein Pro02_71110 [Planobispora rosea]